jgi:hypothetical protein
MKQDNPFAKLGALDQKLFEDTASKTQEMIDKGEEENATSNKLSESQKINKMIYQKVNNLVVKLIFLRRPPNALRHILPKQASGLFVISPMMKTGMITKYSKKQ